MGMCGSAVLLYVSTTVDCDVDDGNVLVYLCIRSSFASVGCPSHLACDVVDKEM